MAETDIAMPESTPVDSRPAFAIVEELKTKFGENFYVQPTCENGLGRTRTCTRSADVLAYGK